MSQERRRARGPEQKAARRADILAAARALLAEVPWQELSMAGLAERLGLAKGTPYLYFGTKEALFLAVLQDELSAWFDALEATLPGPPRPAREVAGLLAGSVAARPDLRRLLALLHGVLEENVSLAEARAFKRFLLVRVEAGGSRLESVVPGLGPGGGAALLLRLHALVIGVQGMTDPSPVVRRALRDPALAPFDVHFEPLLGSTLADLMAGMTSAPRARKRGST